MRQTQTGNIERTTFENINISLYAWSELIVLGYLFVYLLSLSLRNTMFDLWGFYAIQKLLVLSGVPIALLRSYGFFVTSTERGADKRESIAHLFITFIISACFIGSYMSTGYMFLLLLAIIFPCCLGMSYKKVLGIQFVILSFVALSAFIAAASGNITDLVYVSTRSNDDGTTFLRSSLGIIYPTDCASFGFYLLLTAFVLFTNVSEWLFVALGILFSISFWYINNAQNNSRFMFAFVCLVIILKLVIIIAKKFSIIEKLWRILMYLSSIAAPVLAFGMYAACRYYASINAVNPNRASKLDDILHRRLSLGSSAIEQYGIKMFGTAFEMIGSGGAKGSQEDYFFLDSSYMLILIRYGLILLILICLMMAYSVVSSTMRGDYRLPIAILVLSGDFFLEHHAPDLCYNIFILMPFMLMAPAFKYKKSYSLDRVLYYLNKKRKKFVKALKKSKKSYFISISITLLITIITSPFWISLLRTINTLYAFVPSSGKIGSTVCLVMITIFLISVLSISLWKNKALRILGIALFSVCILSFVVLINAKKDTVSSIIESDRSAIEAVSTVKGAKLYSADYPILYMTSHKVINLSPLPVEEMARLSNVSIIVDKNYDSDVLISRGFVYTEISDTHSIYTNSREVSNALQKSGFVVRGYYNTQTAIEFNPSISYQQLSDTYELVVSLTVNNLKDTAYTDVATISVNAAGGDKELLSKTIYTNELDDAGSVQVKYKYYSNYPDVTFELATADGMDISIEEVYCHHYHEQDIRKYYNNKWRVVREEYLDEAGNIVVSSNKYAIADYEYDNKGNVTRTAYYGINNEPVIMKNGYSYAEMTYDNNHKVISCFYYDTNGQLVLSKDNIAGYACEYDSSGYEVMRIYYITDGNPGINGDEYAIRRYEYDDNYRISRESYYDANNKPCKNIKGYASYTIEYDKNDNPILYKYFDENNNPVIIYRGYAQLYRIYDDNSVMLEEGYRDIEGNPVILNKGQAGEEITYDDNGKIISRKYHDETGNLILYNNAYAEIQYEYDLNGRESKITYLGVDGELGYNGDIYAIVRKQYNTEGKVSREEFYDKNDKPVLVNSGFFSREYSYDENNMISSIKYRGLSGEPIYNSNKYVEIHYEYDENKRVISESYFDIDGKPGINDNLYSIYTKKYDDEDHIFEECYLDASGNLINNKSGYSRVVTNYIDNYVASVEYYDENNEFINKNEHREYAMLSDLEGYINQKDTIVFITVKDEATNSLTDVLKADFSSFNLSAISKLPYRGSYIGIIDNGVVVYDEYSNSSETMIYQYQDIATLKSGGATSGNISSCIINDIETSLNGRGFNVVVYDKATNTVIDSTVYDTYKYPIKPLSEY